MKSKAVDAALQEIIQGLRDGLDVSIYAKPEYDLWQMVQIRMGLQSGVDVSIYAKPEYSSLFMYVLRRSLETGIDISSFDGTKEMIDRYKNILMQNGDNILNNYSIPISESTDDIVYSSREEFLEGEYGVNTEGYDDDKLSLISSVLCRLDELDREDDIDVVLKYISPDYSLEQLSEILGGILEGIDVSKYADVNISVDDMQAIEFAIINNVPDIDEFKKYIALYDEYDSKSLLKPYIELFEGGDDDLTDPNYLRGLRFFDDCGCHDRCHPCHENSNN